MPNRLLFTLAIACLSSFSLAAQFEYFADAAHSFSHPVIHTLDDGGAVVASSACRYRPDGTVIIEGCVTFRHLIRLDFRGDTLWTSRLPAGSFANLKSVYLKDDGGLVFFVVQSFSISGCLGGATGNNYLRIIHFSPAGELEQEIRTESCVYSYANVFRLGEDRYATLAYFTERDEWTSEETTLRKLLIMRGDGEIIEERSTETTITRGARLTDDLELEMIFSQDSVLYRQRMDTLLNIISTDTSANLSELAGYYEDGFRSVSFVSGSNDELHVLVRIRDANTSAYRTYYTRYNDDLEISLEREYPDLIDASGFTLHPDGSFYIISTNVDLDAGDLQINHYDAAGNLLETMVEPGPGIERLSSISFELDSLELLMAGDYLCCLFPDSIAKREVFIVRDGIISSLFGSPEPAPQRYRVYPNPAGDVIAVESVAADHFSTSYISVHDAAGRKLMDVPTAGTISVGHLPSGTYFYRIKDGQRVIQSGKFIRR